MRGHRSALASTSLLTLLTLVAAAPATAADCSRTSTGLVPLSDLGAGTYLGAQGGLYPGGSNRRPASHEAGGQRLADGLAGSYALISIGMSNTTQEFQRFVPMANADPGKDPSLAIVDGAQGSVTGSRWADPSDPAWSTLDSRLAAAGVSPDQVRVAWVKLADAGPTNGWPAYAQQLQAEEEAVLRLLRDRFPKLAIAYLSSRIYAGYASTGLNPEPYAYESGFAVKWVIEDQLDGAASLNWDRDDGPVEAPWLSWGPYLWADGLTPRGGDGLTWDCSELAADGTHPSPSGATKVAASLLEFFRSDSTARAWFNASNSSGRELTLKLRGRRVALGDLDAPGGFVDCVAGARIELQRRSSNGAWHRAANDKADEEGAYRIPLDENGRYRTRAGPISAGAEGEETCLGATSRARSTT